MNFAISMDYSKVRRWAHEVAPRFQLHWMLVALSLAFPVVGLTIAAQKLWSTGMTGTAGGDLFDVDVVLQLLCLLVVVRLFFSRAIKPLEVAALMLAGVLLNEVGFFNVVLHEWLISMNLYPSFLVHPQKGFVNPSYARVVISFAIGVVYAAFLLRRSWRTMDRMVAGLIFWSVLITSFLFHWVIVKELSVGFEAEKIHMSAVARLPEDQFEMTCRQSQEVCLRWRAEEEIPSSGDARVDRFVSFLLRNPSVHDVLANEDSAGWLSQLPNGDIASSPEKKIEGLGSFIVLVHKSSSSEFRAVVNVKTFDLLDNHATLIYGILALAAHFTWILGGGYLLFWHKSRFSRRTSAVS